MEKILFLSLAVALLYCFAKMIEMKYISKEMKPLKFLVRDSVIVFATAFLPIFLFFQMDGKMGATDGGAIPTQIFTDHPGF
jgi:hypothetical protein